MADQVTARLQLIALLGVMLIALVGLHAVFPGCMGCGSLTFENPEQAHQFNENVESGMTQAVQSLVVGMSAIAVAGYLAQTAWKRHKAGKPLVPFSAE